MYSNRQTSQMRAVGDMGFEWLCVDVVVYVYRRIYFVFWYTEEIGLPDMFPLIPSALSISLFSKNRSDAAGGCPPILLFLFWIPFFFASKKKVLVYVLLSYTIFLYSLYISANRCTSNLLKMTHLLLISANSQNPPSPALSNLFSKHHLLLKW